MTPTSMLFYGTAIGPGGAESAGVVGEVSNGTGYHCALIAATRHRWAHQGKQETSFHTLEPDDTAPHAAKGWIVCERS